MVGDHVLRLPSHEGTMPSKELVGSEEHPKEKTLEILWKCQVALDEVSQRTVSGNGS